MVTNKIFDLLVYDFDGVLTDNRVLVREDGVESVACNRSDGLWIGKIKELGIEQLILSTEVNPVVSARAKKLGLECIQGQKNKFSALNEIVQKKNLHLNRVAYVGNDVNDLECLKAVHFSFCPKDSHPDVLAACKNIIPVNGGAGVVPWLHQFLTKPNDQKKSPPLPSSSEIQQGIEQTLRASLATKQALLEDKECLSLLETMGTQCAETLKTGGKILFAGNGGSFADSMHLAAEFVSKLQHDREPLASIALGCSNSNLTAIGNDYGYEFTFAREIKALAQKNDVFIAISTSGNSKNILLAVEEALKRGVHVFGWSGKTGGKLASLCPTLKIPSKETARIQECHILVGHILCEIAERHAL